LDRRQSFLLEEREALLGLMAKGNALTPKFARSQAVLAGLNLGIAPRLQGSALVAAQTILVCTTEVVPRGALAPFLEVIHDLLKGFGLVVLEMRKQHHLHGRDHSHADVVVGCVWIAILKAHEINQILEADRLTHPVAHGACKNLGVDLVHHRTQTPDVEANVLIKLRHVVPKRMAKHKYWTIAKLGTVLVNRPTKTLREHALGLGDGKKAGIAVAVPGGSQSAMFEHATRGL
jgi:hypothetical protein